MGRKKKDLKEIVTGAIERLKKGGIRGIKILNRHHRERYTTTPDAIGKYLQVGGSSFVEVFSKKFGRRIWIFYRKFSDARPFPSREKCWSILDGYFQEEGIPYEENLKRLKKNDERKYVRVEKHVYHAHNPHISATFEYRGEEGWYRIKGSFIEVGIGNFYKIWSIKKEKSVWTLEVREGVEGEWEKKNSKEVGTLKQEATRLLINKIVGEFLDSSYISFKKLEKALRKCLDFRNKLKDKERRCLADGGKCEPSKKPRGLCNSIMCGG